MLVAEVWAAEAQLIAWEIVWVEDRGLVFVWSKVLERIIANMLGIGKARGTFLPYAKVRRWLLGKSERVLPSMLVMWHGWHGYVVGIGVV